MNKSSRNTSFFKNIIKSYKYNLDIYVYCLAYMDILRQKIQ